MVKMIFTAIYTHKHTHTEEIHNMNEHNRKKHRNPVNLYELIKIGNKKKAFANDDHHVKLMYR